MADVKPEDQSKTGSATSTGRNRFVDAVVQMTKLTQEGKMKWRSLPSRSGKVSGGWSIIQPSNEGEFEENRFQTLYRGRRFVLTRIATLGGRSSFPGLQLYVEPGWQFSYRLNIVDDNDAILFSFPSVEALQGLHSTIQDQLANVDAVLKDLYAE